MPCPRPIHAAPLALPFPSVRERWRGWWRGAAGVPEVPGGFGGSWASGALRARGQGNACGMAWEWAGSTAGERAEARGRGWAGACGMRWVRVFSGNSNQTAPCGVSLAGLPAEPCRAFQRFYAVPHGISRRRLPALSCRAPGPSMPRLWRFPSLRSGEGGGGGGAVRRESRKSRGGQGVLGIWGVTGLRAGGRLRRGKGVGGGQRQGSGLRPAAGLGFGFLREIRPDCAFRRFSAGPPGRSLPRFPAPPCSAPGPLMLALPTPPGCTSGTSLPRLGRSPVGTRASRAVLHSRLAPLALCGKEGRERWQRFP